MDTSPIALPALGFPVTPDDLRRISQGRDAASARNLIVDIIHRMEPRTGSRRVYVCEPRSLPSLAGVWDVAYDLTITTLIEYGDQVIDPHFLEILAVMHPTLAELANVGKRNLFLSHLLDKGLLDTVCLPGNISESEYNVIHRRTLPSPCPVSVEFYSVFFDQNP